MGTNIERVKEYVKRYPNERIQNLAVFLTYENLESALYRLKKDKATGIDKMTVDEYIQNKEDNLKCLVHRLKYNNYYPQPSRRVEIPKLNGKKISTGTTVKKNGKYKLILTDNAGNQKIVNFTIKN